MSPGAQGPQGGSHLPVRSILGTLQLGCLHGVLSTYVSVEGVACPRLPGPCPPSPMEVAFRTWRPGVTTLPASCGCLCLNCGMWTPPASLPPAGVSELPDQLLCRKACGWCLLPRNTCLLGGARTRVDLHMFQFCGQHFPAFHTNIVCFFVNM